MKRSRCSVSTSVEGVHKKQSLEASKMDDVAIHRLEKLLKIKKGKKRGDSEKSNKVHSMFVNDGLDYLLDVVDSKQEDLSFFTDTDLGGSEGGPFKNQSNYKKNQMVSTQQSHSKISTNKQRTLTDLLREKEGTEEISEDSYSSDSDCDELSEGYPTYKDVDNSSNKKGSNVIDINKKKSAKEDSIKKNKKTNNQSEKTDLWQDIYGRLRDKEGNIVEEDKEESKLYVPPAKRNNNFNANNKNNELILKIQRKLKGLLNRLGGFNIKPISLEIEEMYMKNSRNDMNESLLLLISELALSPTLTPPALIRELAMVVSLLHANVGSEIGAYFLQHLSVRFDKFLKSGPSYGNKKECDNILVFLSHLYNFKVTSSVLIFDILKLLIDSFQDKDIELIHLLFKNVGFSLRKDDPLLLKEIIIKIQSKAVQFNTQQDNSRINFMLETLTAIRNNNMYKIPGYDPGVIDRAKKTLKSFIRKGALLQVLSISLEDLLNAEEKGRWWIVGSAWSEREKSLTDPKEENKTAFPEKSDASEKILELARKQHMNTGTRKTIFCILMSAEDFMNAFEKLIKLNLKNQQEREIVNVILHCTLQEKTFNLYYAFLMEKFCTFNRRFKLILQYSVWDRFKEMSNMKQHQVNNLAQLLIHLFIRDVVSLSILKVIQLSEMNKNMVSFFRTILSTILLNESEEVCSRVFKRIAPAKNLNLLKEGLKIFMHHFLLRDQSKYTPETAQKLKKRVQMVENVLNSSKRAFKL